jgi:hypothetical protein
MKTYHEMTREVASLMHQEEYEQAADYLLDHLSNPSNMNYVLDEAFNLLRTAGIRKARATKMYDEVVARIAEAA